jgi:hypothetical protein
MAAVTDPVILRQRAGVLRRLAALLDASMVRRLPALAGDDKWCGPTATAFLDDAHALRRALDVAVADLRHDAARLERQAEALPAGDTR